MIAIPQTFLCLPSLQIWWPEDESQVISVLDHAPTISVMQCSDDVARSLSPHAFRQAVFYTSLIDLTLPAETLRRQLHRKSCRSEVAKAEAMAPLVSVNMRTDAARELINRAVATRGYRRTIARREWNSSLEHADVFVAELDGSVMAAHVILKNFPERARLLFSATGSADGDTRSDRIAGCLNRFLHWSEFLYYKEQGFRVYDFGGVVVDPAFGKLYSISQFKLSFGGTVVRENNLRLAAGTLLRLALRGAAKLRSLYLRSSPGATAAKQDRLALH